MPAKTVKPKDHRVHLASPELREQIESLAKRSPNANNFTDVVKRAVALYDLVLEHVEEGGKLVFRHKDGSEETLRFL